MAKTSKGTGWVGSEKRQFLLPKFVPLSDISKITTNFPRILEELFIIILLGKTDGNHMHESYFRQNVSKKARIKSVRVARPFIGFP